MLRLKNKVAVVTGASQGIGKAIALKFVREGASVVIVNRTSETGFKAKQEIIDEQITIQSNGVVRYKKGDVAQKKQIEQIMKYVINTLGKIDILVNNAGFDRGATLLKVTEEDWDAVLGVHLKGTLNCIQAVAPYMIERKYGKIVNVSSIVGRTGYKASISYTSAKGGIIALTKSVARELAKHNINVNAVLPGWTETPPIQAMAEKYRQMIIDETPLKRMAQPEEIANVVAFLASDEASFMMGACVEVTGGCRM